MPPARLAAPLAALSLLLPATARAADPIMPLSQVSAGMHCTGYSVVRGVDISSFDVDVIDVVVDSGQSDVLVKVSGPAVDESGIAEGFSGSPVYCPDGRGGTGVIGAIAEGTGDYGNKLVLVTPIETMLGEPVDPPSGARPLPRALRASRRPLAAPLSFGGVSGPVATALRRTSRRLGRALYAAPAAPRAAFPPQELRPGSSVAVGLASGDLTAGAVGTVTYVDGDRVWAFGHPLDAAGRRSLLLEDAWVYAVVPNPVDAEDLTSYKLASPGHDLGTLTNDAPSAVVGRLGVLPTRIPLRINAKDDDTGRELHRTIQIADETAAGLPTGSSSLSQVGPVAVAQAAFDILRGAPADQSGRMCVRITLRERRTPARFCNTYVGGSPGAGGAPMASDFASAAGILDSFKLGVVHVTGVDVSIVLRRELRQAYIVRVDAPRTVRRGRSARVRIVARRVRGPQFTRTFRMRVPRGTPRGYRDLVLTGTPADGGGFSDMANALEAVFTLTFDDSSSGDARGPASVAALARSIGGLGREDGVTGAFVGIGQSRDDADAPEFLAYRDPVLRLSGRARTTVRVTAGHRRR